LQEIVVRKRPFLCYVCWEANEELLGSVPRECYRGIRKTLRRDHDYLATYFALPGTTSFEQMPKHDFYSQLTVLPPDTLSPDVDTMTFRDPRYLVSEKSALRSFYLAARSLVLRLRKCGADKLRGHLLHNNIRKAA
jgi:hypothetical protein